MDTTYMHAAACIFFTHFSLRFIIKSGFKPREGYYGACTVVLNLIYKKKSAELSHLIEITFTCPSMVFDFLPIFIPFQSIICMMFDNINNNTFFFFLRVRCSSNWPMKSILNYQLEPKQKNWKYLNFCHKQ